MPHSVSSEASIEDKELPDAPSPLESPTTGESDVMETKIEDEPPKKAPEVRLGEIFDDQEDDEFSSSAPFEPAATGESDAMDTTKEGDVPKKAHAVKLEDIFDDDDGDEFSSSVLAPPIQGDPINSSPPPLPEQTNSASPYTDPYVMLAFYQRLFPFRILFQWLNHSIKPSNDFAHREIAFTLPNDAYLRYQSYPTAEMLRKDVLRLNPSRFEIGPVYSTNPRDRKALRKASVFRPISKELVFDIDLTDYDEIRTCCDKANICHKCWRFVVMAIKVVDAALREDFGFEHILWVYSGRRGAHAWISDKKAREMPDDRRKAVAGYLGVITGGAQSGRKVNLRRPLHPHLARSLELLKPHFQTDILEDQDPWSSPSRAETLLSLIPDKSLAEALRKKWDSAPGRSSSNKWADIDSLAKAGVSRNLDTRALLEAKKDIILEYTYPRLDVEVSKKLIHLLKSPFVVHPKTGRVCVPIDMGRLDKFDPIGVPTVTELLDEIDKWGKKGTQDEDWGAKVNGAEMEEEKKVPDYEKTRLKPYVEYFKAHVAALLKEEKGIKREREEAGGDAMEF